MSDEDLWQCESMTLVSPCQYEAKSRLEGMSGSTAISSADLFGDGSDNKGTAPHLLQHSLVTRPVKAPIDVLLLFCFS